MAKHKQGLVPWPEGVWHTRGSFRASGVVSKIRSHLEQMRQAGTIQNYRLVPAGKVAQSKSVSVWWTFDAGWVTPDGARVRGRLELVPNKVEASLRNLTPEQISSNNIALQMGWLVTAHADRPWQPEWLSPTLAFFPSKRKNLWWDLDSVQCQLHLTGPTAFERITSQHGSLLKELSQATHYTTVITHDRRLPSAEPFGSVADVLPKGMMTRVVEIRAYADQDQMFNELLAEYRVALPWGGAVILPSTPRREGWASADYGIKAPSGDNFEELLRQTALHIRHHCELSPHYDEATRDSVESLQASWKLPEPKQSTDQVSAELEEANRQIETLTENLASACQREEALAKEKHQAEILAEELRVKTEEMSRTNREDPLAERAAQVAAQAEEAFAAEEAAQSLAEDLTAEVSWLRRQLAQVPGRSYAEPAPERAKGPESWEELVGLASDLFAHVRIGAIWGPVEKLVGHSKEKVWLRRSWAVLELLDAYADARKKHGPDEIPHISAYLAWDGAMSEVPVSWYCPAEVNLERAGTDNRMRRTRLFRAAGLGEVFMGAHFRIGGPRPPAPRLHLFDDSAGETGLIHIGYIGPHLPTVTGR